MRKILILFSLFLSLVGIESCKKDSFVAAFDKSAEERMSDTIDFVKTTLVSAPNGWIVTTPVYYGGGYGFYMKFDDSLNVTMYSDLSDAFATTAYTSQTRVRADLGVALTFDTYNYILELNNPDNNVRNGYGGDVDYIYDHTNGDSIIFLGKRYRKTLNFVKASSNQQQAYLSGGYLTAINGFKNFFTTNPNAYIKLANGTLISIEPNATNSLTAGKRITLTALSPDGVITSATAKFAYTVDQMAILDSGVNLSNLSFVRIAWKSAGVLAIYTSTGEEYIINNSVSPILPLYMLMGVKFNTLFGGAPSNYPAGLPGTSTAGLTMLNYYYSNLANRTTGYVFNYGTVSLIWNLANQRITLRGFCSQNGGTSGWNTDIIYSYTINANHQYKLTLYSAASGGYTSILLTQLDTFLRNNTLTLDYYVSGSTTYGQFKSVETPTTTLSFLLQ